MQHRYTADVGDSGKYALLNASTGADLRLGVMWYLNPVEEANADGRFTDYPVLKPCDPALHDKLSRILLHSRRSLSLKIEKSEILPSDTLFHCDPLPFRSRPWASRSTQGHSKRG